MIVFYLTKKLNKNEREINKMSYLKYKQANDLHEEVDGPYMQRTR